MVRVPKTATARGSILVISAPSGSGKSTLTRRVMAAFPGLRFSVSYTTRAPRAGEKQGRDYFFVSQKVFKRMIAVSYTHLTLPTTPYV